MTDHGRGGLAGARNERDSLIDGMRTMGNAIEKLMDDRVRHMEALRQIAALTETYGHPDVYRIAKEALEEDG